MVVMVNSSIVTHLNNIEVVSDCTDLTHWTESKAEDNKRVKYDWDANTQGLILGAIYYGILLTLIPGAVLSEKFGAKWFFGGPVLFSTVLTLLTPITASSDAVPLIILRILQGLAEGLTFPAINILIAKWSHILERSRFVSLIYIGIHLGNVVSPIVTGWLSSTDILGGWPLAFYVFGISGCIWFIFWAIFIYETPGVHRNISAKELQYLEGNNEISKKTSKKFAFTYFCLVLSFVFFTTFSKTAKLATPWKAIFSSVPVWVAVIANVSNEFAFVIFMTEIPTYLSTALHFGVLNVGLLSALGFTVKAIVAWFASYIADLLRKWDRLSITNIRKLFTAVGRKMYNLGIFNEQVDQRTVLIISINLLYYLLRFAHFLQYCTLRNILIFHYLGQLKASDKCALFGPAICLLGVTLSGCHLWRITGLVILSTAASGFFYAGVGTVHIDLSPTFAGTILAIIDVFGTITGIVGPSIVGALTLKVTTVAQWNNVFYLVAAFQVISGLAFAAFGSAELQSWGKDNNKSSSEVEQPKLNSSKDGTVLKNPTFLSLPPALATTPATKEYMTF